MVHCKYYVVILPGVGTAGSSNHEWVWSIDGA